jgi:hypothetical protein
MFVNIGQWSVHVSNVFIVPTCLILLISIIQVSTLALTRIILRPLSALSLDEGLNSPCDKNASAALWKREPISDDYLLGNVCKHRSMERSGVKCFHCTHVFDLTNLKGEKRRNVGKLNNNIKYLLENLIHNSTSWSRAFYLILFKIHHTAVKTKEYNCI